MSSASGPGQIQSGAVCVGRYMDKNREITRIKREEIRRLKEHLSLLQQRMERYLMTSLFFNSNQEVLLRFLS